MAKRNQEVQNRVRQEMQRDPTLGSRQLFEMAQEYDPSLKDAPLAQFHARYVLPVKREQAAQRKQSAQQTKPRRSRQARGAAAQEAPAKPQEERTRRRSRRSAAAEAEQPAPEAAATRKPRAKRGAAQRGDARGQIRAIFLQFAREFADAETRTEIVQVLSKVDDYVEQVVERTS